MSTETQSVARASPVNELLEKLERLPFDKSRDLYVEELRESVIKAFFEGGDSDAGTSEESA